MGTENSSLVSPIRHCHPVAMPTNEDTAARATQEIEEQRRVNRNLRRRTKYAQMSPGRKQSFLSQLRVKRAESKKQRLSYHAINHYHR